MFYNYNEDYQYDSCISKGICSINPRTSSLREVLVMYLKQLAFYTLQLKYMGVKNNLTEDIILNTLSGLMSNLETGNEQFYQTLVNLKMIIIESMDIYKKVCNTRNIKIKEIESEIKLQKRLNITSLIQLGEQEFSRKLKLIPEEKRNLYEIMFLVIKSICINLVELKSFGLDDNYSFNEILYLLNSLNYPKLSVDILNKKIKHAVKTDFCLVNKIYNLRIERYGEQTETEVSYSTRPNKAILVAGTNIQELKNVLDATRDKNIDIYTHGEMIVAYTYPLFREYEHLRGQFGKGIENCLLDFATFPGAILIAKHSLENIEYLYRGRLFTTDNFVPRGVIKVNNKDFSRLINSALSAKGFKTGREKDSIKYGCNIENFNHKLDFIINNKQKYKNIVIIGTEVYNHEQKDYFNKLLKFIPKNTIVISLTNEFIGEKIININMAPDFYTIYRIINKLKSINIDITLFLAKCDKHTISNVLNLKELGVKNVFLSKCTPIMLNPTLTNTLKTIYHIKPTTNASKDINILNK